MSKPRVLVLSYSQSGQLRDILDSTLSEVASELDITRAMIEPVTAFPFPWKASTFFDAMPESVLLEPSPIKPLPDSIVNGDYDLVVFGWQPWFLHPSQPVTAFLQSPSAKVLAGKPVITIVGSRNMWLNAGEKMKEGLQMVGAKHIGAIVFTDTNTNLVSLLTIIRWSFSGRKEATKYLPEAGVQSRDIKAASRFGRPILAAAKTIADTVSLPEISNLHNELLNLGAIELNTGLVLLEQRGIKNFRFWAKYIKEKGGPASPARKGRVTNFKRLLLVGIFVLSPLSSLTAMIKRKLHKKRLEKDVQYFKQLSYEPGRI